MKRIPRRVIGLAMIGIGLGGILVSATAVVVGHHLIRQVETSLDDTLELTNDALAAVSDSIIVIDSVVSTIRSGMTSVRSTIATVDHSLGQASAAVAETGEFLGGSLPESIDAVQEVLPTIESIAGSIDRALQVLERVPFGPSYDPVQPFDQAITDLSMAIEPLPDQLRTLNGDLQRVGSSARAVKEQMDGLAGDIDRLDGQLGGVAALLDRYAGTASQAERLALASRADLAASARWAGLVLILFGIVFALGQLVPLWLGSCLAAGWRSSERPGETTCDVRL